MERSNTRRKMVIVFRKWCVIVIAPFLMVLLADIVLGVYGTLNPIVHCRIGAVVAVSNVDDVVVLFTIEKHFAQPDIFVSGALSQVKETRVAYLSKNGLMTISSCGKPLKLLLKPGVTEVVPSHGGVLFYRPGPPNRGHHVYELQYESVRNSKPIMEDLGDSEQAYAEVATWINTAKATGKDKNLYAVLYYDNELHRQFISPASVGNIRIGMRTEGVNQILYAEYGGDGDKVDLVIAEVDTSRKRDD